MAKPKPRAADLDASFMIRCNSEDLARWKERAAELGFGGASALVRKVMNESDLLRAALRDAADIVARDEKFKARADAWRKLAGGL
jgi:hypothetical protein